MYFLLGMLVCAPLIASAVGKGWDLVWAEKRRSVIPASLDHGLTVIHAILCTAFVLSPAPVVLYAVAAVYAVMGAGVLWLRVQRGRADCGCWGRSRSGRLGYGLAAADLGLAVLAAAVAAMFAEPALPPLTVRLFGFATALILALFAMVILPAYLPLLKRYRELAARYRPWLEDFPDLRAPS
ncbi:MauE/DoxX family redox-associated membrane protein [Sinosporangium siamense]|uniref:Methylamine utilization protein MauE n=1 Tax=Sinosporangium siamense TaxID=1367973 RepID=A0A919V5Z3_9ACTN|nr:MauE/DoxX family redox-associated membrane protein [Sinosporangium siamense]GII91968.1 hypothetical protein Ssi02_21990 [Sinosporangium siamense]